MAEPTEFGCGDCGYVYSENTERLGYAIPGTSWVCGHPAMDAKKTVVSRYARGTGCSPQCPLMVERLCLRCGARLSMYNVRHCADCCEDSVGDRDPDLYRQLTGRVFKRVAYGHVLRNIHN